MHPSNNQHRTLLGGYLGLRPPPTIARMLQRKSISTMPMPPLEKSAQHVPARQRLQDPTALKLTACVCLPRWNVSLNGSQLKILKPVSVPHAKHPARHGDAPRTARGTNALSVASPLVRKGRPPRGEERRTVVLVEPHEEELVLLLAAEVHGRHGSRNSALLRTLLGRSLSLLPSLCPRRLPFFSRLFFSPRSSTEETPRTDTAS